MKKSLVSMAVLGVVATAAHAQSSVTLYGIINEGITMNTNSGGKHQYYLSSGVLQGSRFGFRGAEDLGGGYKAVFVLENGFDLNSGKLGQGGLEFGRQGYVGLSGPWGKMTLGRQYDSVIDYLGVLEVGDQWGGYITAHPGDVDNFNNDFRTNNALKFTSINYNGLSFSGMYSLGGVAGQTGRNQVFSLGVGYNNGPLVLAAAYLNARNPNVGFFGNNTSGAISPTVSNLVSPVISGFGSANTYQVIGTGGAYTFGAATVGATYSNTRFMNLGASYASAFAGRTATFNNAEFNFRYQFTPSFLAGVAYDYTKGSSINGTSAAQYHQGAVGVDYFLSKRTDLYAVAVYQHALGNTLSANGNAIVPAVAAISNISASSNQNQFAGHVGIRHLF